MYQKFPKCPWDYKYPPTVCFSCIWVWTMTEEFDRLWEYRSKSLKSNLPQHSSSRRLLMRAFERRVTTGEAVTPEIRPRVQTCLTFPSLYLWPSLWYGHRSRCSRPKHWQYLCVYMHSSPVFNIMIFPHFEQSPCDVGEFTLVNCTLGTFYRLDSRKQWNTFLLMRMYPASS